MQEVCRAVSLTWPPVGMVGEVDGAGSGFNIIDVMFYIVMFSPVGM